MSSGIWRHVNVDIGTKISQEVVASVFSQVQDYKFSHKKEGKGGKNRRPVGLVVLRGGPQHVMEQEAMVKMWQNGL
jgi:hypothetical protein